MNAVLLTLLVPQNIAQTVEDLLLEQQALVSGFTSIAAHGHGSSVVLLEPAERVAGHAPRVHIQLAGSEAHMQQLLAQLKTALPRATIFYWLTPVIAMGHL
ncbi:MAG: DUF3240 family protein [Dechloromonas sp.]|nr:DUF3240 family protein [Dechloromonas sp.]